MKRLALFACLAAAVALADTDLYKAGTRVGPIKALNCVSDGGVLCWRDAGSIGQLQCNAASATETGCVTPGAQTWAGDKSLTGFLRAVGVAHASLTACDNSHKNMLQGCTTHGAPVWCNGTVNIEMTGSSAAEEVLYSLFVDGVPAAGMGAFNLSSTSGATITSVTGLWGAGTGAGSLPISFVHSGGTCTCTIDCDVPGARTACSGSCSVSASALVTAARGTSTCTLNPYVVGNLGVMGTKP